MKEIKKDILEITPKIIGEVAYDEEAVNISEKSFEEIFKEFYAKERGVEATDEVVEMLLKIMLEEGDKDETNQIEDKRIK